MPDCLISWLLVNNYDMNKKILKKQVKYNNCVANNSKFKVSNKPKILSMPKVNSVLSDSELNSIFNGLLRLIKKNTMLHFETIYHDKLDYLVTRLNECICEIELKDRQIKELTKSK